MKWKNVYEFLWFDSEGKRELDFLLFWLTRDISKTQKHLKEEKKKVFLLKKY